jgi:hypothetical protein
MRASGRPKFDSVNAKIIELVAAGETVVGACEQVGVNPHTCRNWITTGRRSPEGRYGGFVKALDATRASVRLDREEEDGYEPGPVEREVRALIAGRDLDAHGRIAAAQGRALARQVDSLVASRSGSAALGLAAVSRRLDDVIVALHIQPRDAVSEIVEARRARLARRGIPVAGDGSAPGNGVVHGVG